MHPVHTPQACIRVFPGLKDMLTRTGMPSGKEPRTVCVRRVPQYLPNQMANQFHSQYPKTTKQHTNFFQNRSKKMTSSGSNLLGIGKLVPDYTMEVKNKARYRDPNSCRSVLISYHKEAGSLCSRLLFLFISRLSRSPQY